MNVTIIWLILFVVLIAIEIASLGLTTIWFAAGALVATIAAAFGVPIFLQIILFIAVSSVLLFFTRPIAVKYFNGDRTKTNAESLVGKQAVVTSEINNLLGNGQVNVSGLEWSARAESEGRIISIGKIVDILEIRGVKLIVKERKEED